MSRRWGAIALLLAASQSACLSSLYERVERTSVIDRRILEEKVDTREVGPVELRVTGVLVIDTILKGQIERSASCQVVTTRKVEPVMRTETVYVDSDDDVANLGRAAWVEFGLGVAMPLIGPLAYIADLGDDDEDEDDDDDDDPLTATEIRTVFIVSGILGGLLILDSIITGLVSQSAGTKSEEIGPPQTEVHESGIEPCPYSQPLNDRTATYFFAGTSSAAVFVFPDGRFDFDLRRVAGAIVEDPTQPWSLVRADGTSCSVDVPLTDRISLAGRLDRAQKRNIGPAKM